MSGVFISYRRGDTAPYAGRLRDALRARFGPDQVFRDLDHIAPGERFESVIDSAVTSCKVLVALIGPRWFGVREGGKRRSRLHDPDDYVRREVAAALRRDDVLLIPVLVEGAQMPSAAQLPPDLVALPAHQALGLTDEGWDAEVGRLMEIIESRLRGDDKRRTMPLLAVPAPAAGVTGPGGGPRARRPWIGVGAAVAAIVATVTGLRLLPASGGSEVVGKSGPVAETAETTTTTSTTTTSTTAPAATTTRPASPPGAGYVAPAAQSPSAPRTPPPTAPPPSTSSTTTTRPLPPETCRAGYVWRNPGVGDLVCVTPKTADQVAFDNSVRASRWANGPYGPHTCVSGYVWRDAFDGDDVCVLPEVRDQAVYDNSQAARRRIGG